MRRSLILFLLVVIMIAGCRTNSEPTVAIPTIPISPTSSALPTAMPTVLPTIELSPTPAFTPTPAMNYVGGIVEANGWVRYTSRTAGISIALPPNWRCINMDSDLYEESLVEARASLNPVPVSFERLVDAFKTDHSYRMYCFVPDSDAVDSLTNTELNLQEFAQVGYTSALKMMEDRQVADECPYVEETIDGHDAAMSECTMTLQLRRTTTFYRRVDYVLDRDRSIALDFMGLDEDLLQLYAEIAHTLMFTE